MGICPQCKEDWRSILMAFMRSVLVLANSDGKSVFPLLEQRRHDTRPSQAGNHITIFRPTWEVEGKTEQ